MREDMFKVIVERPRRGGGNAREESPFRLTDPEDGGPSHAPLRAPRQRSKMLNENLAPLQRFLDKSVGRHWNKVHAEVCEHLAPGNVVQQHVLQHLGDYVALRTELRDGTIWVAARFWGGATPLAKSRYRLYVHPLSGVLLENRACIHRRQLRRQRDEGARVREAATMRVLAPGVRLERINDVWFELRFTVPQTHEEVRAGPALIGKRQLGKKELRKFGL